MKLKKFEGNPILSPLDSNDWESLVTWQSRSGL